MKVKVLQDFRDRTADLVLREAGEELEVTKDRAELLMGRGLVERIREPAKKTAKKAEKEE